MAHKVHRLVIVWMPRGGESSYYTKKKKNVCVLSLLVELVAKRIKICSNQVICTVLKPIRPLSLVHLTSAGTLYLFREVGLVIAQLDLVQGRFLMCMTEHGLLCN